ncbi:hypothetical protein [Mesoterricola sediminis]|uniref:Ribbon-helix-helix protein, CopG family n=1 Tax=Mesoterricola sediminis TaxID=2927980 RepID=A0AA48KBV0_9BACT|nr:hypothetical protein [Mesoterricola sediminis]BDU76266.1 hypothetical protein METESE_12240 [Mesoterricola sediminis]
MRAPLITVSIWIPISLLIQINRDARDRGMSRDAWIKAALEAQFEAPVEAAS